MPQEEHFNSKVYLSLSEESQERVYHIYVIAGMLHEHRCSPITPSEFDKLYDKTSAELEKISGYVKYQLEHIEEE